MLLCAHALHAHDRRWLVNEKGAIASAGRYHVRQRISNAE